MSALEAFRESELLRLTTNLSLRGNDEIATANTASAAVELSATTKEEVVEGGEDSLFSTRLSAEDEGDSDDISLPEEVLGPVCGAVQKSVEDADVDIERVALPLPNELMCRVVCFLNADEIARSARVSFHWMMLIFSHGFLWHAMCQRVFNNNPAYRSVTATAVKRFGSWRAAFLRRKRVRSTGIYCLRQSYIRDPGPRTMWSVGYDKFHLVKHYRYIYFARDGTCLYAVTPESVPEVLKGMIKSLHGSECADAGTSSAPPTRKRRNWKQASRDASQIRQTLILRGEYRVRGAVVDVRIRSLYNQITCFRFDLSSSHDGAHDTLAVLDFWSEPADDANNHLPFVDPASSIVRYEVGDNRNFLFQPCSGLL